jgi:hypothetical protein
MVDLLACGGKWESWRFRGHVVSGTTVNNTEQTTSISKIAPVSLVTMEGRP